MQKYKTLKKLKKLKQYKKKYNSCIIVRLVKLY